MSGPSRRTRSSSKGAQDEVPDGLTVCLVTALTVADFIDPELIAQAHVKTGAQLGVLTLAARLREHGFVPLIANLDDLFFDFVRRRKMSSLGELFFSFVAGHLRERSADVFGLSSICSSYPLTLRLAEEIRRSSPGATIVVGGPQASVVDVATLQAFPCIDAIVRGEADDTFPALLQLLKADDSRWETIGGITFRRGDEIVRNQNAPAVDDLDRLPLPAFDLDTRIRDRGGIHLEIGRGCPFACTFCSTNDFFRRNFRLKSTPRMIADIGAIKREFGVTYFSLVHDMYTIDRKEVVAFCEAAIASAEPFTWGCSARTDCVDDELLALMARAGCTGIFFGIETGSQRLQKIINKKLDLAEAKRRIAAADRHRVNTTVALIVGFPEETRDDLRDTIHFFIDCLRFDHAEPQCSLLAPLAATPVYDEHKHHLVLDHIFSDMSHQSWSQDPIETAMIEAHPDIFPNFYAIPTVLLERRYIKEVMDFATYLATWFRWLPVVILQDSGDLLGVFDRWQQWRTARPPRHSDEDIGWTPYYSHRRFHHEFLEFVDEYYVPEMAHAKAAVAAAARAEAARASDTCPPVVQEADSVEAGCIPYRRHDLIAIDVEVDYKQLIESLKNGSDLSLVAASDTIVAFNPADEQLDVWQLPPVSASLLRLCDGRRTVSDIAREFSPDEALLGGIPIGTACVFGLTQLRDDGFIGLSSAPLIWQKEDPNSRSPRVSLPPQVGNTQQPWPPRC
jgi:radical SAM superfamily enzyme YgiQ (UPF0313 family)